MASDPTFLTDLWWDRPLDERPSLGKGSFSIGVIFRSWEFDSPGRRYFPALYEATQELQREGIAVEYISLSKEADLNIIQQLPKNKVRVWEPSLVDNNPYEFVRKIRNDFSLIVSARAHGVILPATMGVPAICVDIEPKLRSVHSMLSKSTRLWEAPFFEKELIKIVHEMKTNYENYVDCLEKEVEYNRRLAQEALKELLDFVGKNLQVA